MLKLLIAAVAALLALPVLLAAIATGSPTQAPTHVKGVPDTLLDAYTTAAAEAVATGRCDGMRWQILAGIGQIESDLAAGHDIAENGDITPPIIGPRLDGSGTGGNTTPHYDTDNGRWDNDAAYDRAVGPNQHLPSGWDDYGADGNNDGVKDPHNAYDSALASARELCFSGGDSGTDLTDRDRLSEALFRYNHSDAYVADVLAAIDSFDSKAPDFGDAPGSKKGQAAVAWALDQVGKPYIWGGAGPAGSTAPDWSGAPGKPPASTSRGSLPTSTASAPPSPSIRSSRAICCSTTPVAPAPRPPTSPCMSATGRWSTPPPPAKPSAWTRWPRTTTAPC